MFTNKLDAALWERKMIDRRGGEVKRWLQLKA